jgi:ferredoxin
MAEKIPTIQIIRRVTLGVALVGLILLTALHQRMQGIPSIDALDPFGGLETLLKFLAGGEFIKKIEPGNIVLLGAIVALGIVLSRFFCGWFCAFGALQGVFGWLGRKVFRRRFIVPAKLDAILRWLKYPVLVAIVYFTWRTGELVIRPYDPLAAFGHLPAGLAAVWAEFAVGFVILVVILVFSMIYERAFCKYLCPLGAVNAILGRIPLFRIKREKSTCISCSKCDKVCPMNIEVSTVDTVKSPECISCMECVTSCPTEKNTLSASLGGKTVKTGTIVALGFAIYLGAALVGQATGMLRFSAKSLGEQAAAGALRVEDIKGSSTYQSVADAFGIDLERLYREAGVESAKVPPDAMLKDTGKLMGLDAFEADTVRVAVARILGVPYAGEKGDAPAPSTAAPTEPTIGVLKSGSLAVPAGFALEGTMSVNDVAKALNASPKAVAEKLELPQDIPLDTPLRDMKDKYGYTMPELKERILK